MALEDAASLAAEGQAQGQADRVQHVRARHITSYLDQARKLNELIIHQTNGRNR